jgi:arylsulfatase A-like enzyme
MKRDGGWKWYAGFGWKVGVVIGGCIGFQEGFLAATVKSDSATNVPLTRVVQLVQVYFTPILAEMLFWGLLGLLGALVLHLAFGRWFRPCGTRDGFIPLFSGLMAGLGNSVFVFFLLNSRIGLAMLIDPQKLLFNLRLVLSGVLVGVAVGFMVRTLRARARGHRVKSLLVAFSLWALLLTPAAMWVNRVHLKFSFSLLFFGVSALFLLLLAAATWLTAAWLSPRYLKGTSRYPLVRHLSVVVVLLFALPVFLPTFLAGPADAEVRPAGPGRGVLDRNVILISVDTLRADRISSSGNDPCNTPNIDRLAEEGILFSRAQAPAPWTLSSICSILTSMYPTAHGVLKMQDQLDRLRETVTEKVAAGGYNTAAVVSNGWLLEPFGVDQGFAVFDHMKHRLRAAYWAGHLWYRAIHPAWRRFSPAGDEVQDDTADCALNLEYALQFLEANRSGNFFFWLHVIDPHEPYVARDRWIADAGRDYQGHQIDRLNSGLVISFRGGRVLDRGDRRHIEDLYNREVEYTDMVLGRFLDRIYQLGLTRNTMIIFTSDHGEEFWEHDNVSHGHTCFTELVNVPLIIRPADEEQVARSRSIAAQVSLVDLAPTILDFLGLPGLDHAEGQSLLPVIRGEEQPADRPAFYEAMAYFGEKKAVSDGRFKFVLTEETGREELYDLLEDPGEQRNLVHERPELKLELKGLLMDHLTSQRELASSLETSGEKAEIDADTRAHLRALGYLN